MCFKASRPALMDFPQPRHRVSVSGSRQHRCYQLHIFSLGTVVFLGYSVNDQYVIDLLSDNAKDMSLFGTGPHFVISSDFKSSTTLRKIGYSLKRFPDHRSAPTVLDLIRQVETRKAELSARVVLVQTEDPAKTGPLLGAKTAYFISEVMPLGTWSS